MSNKLRVFEAFAGYGSQSIALRNTGVPYEVVAISEIDKYAIQAYESIHGKVNNLGDISKIKVEDIPEHDLFTYSFPCQDISIIGSQNGIIKGKTRSGLLYECEKIIENKKPKYLLMENVKNLVGKKFKKQFDEWCNYLEDLGYRNYWKVLNAKDYGIPQNRERVFVVSILKEDSGYEFPNGKKLTKRLKDILDDKVDEKYYFNQERVNKLLYTKKEYIDIRDNNRIIQITSPKFSQLRVYSIEGISPTISTGNNGGGKEPCKILIDSNKVRKITPKETFRLMGMRDKDIEKIQLCGISDTQQYKMAGNSIVINVLEEIFKELFKCNGKHIIEIKNNTIK